MILIPDNSTLREFIPNTLAPAMGETPLYHKIQPFLVAAENWFTENFIPVNILKEIVDKASDENDPLYFLPRRIVVLKAWINAMPSIDVVIGPTGVGVTETASLKPASKAKVDRLLDATCSELDYNIEALVNILWRIPDWLESRQADRFRASLFPDFSLLDALGLNKDRYRNWLVFSDRASIIERRIAREWISVPVLVRLRSNLLARVCKGLELEVAQLVRSAVVEELRTGIEQKAAIEDATNIIRKNRSAFPEWAVTDTAARFNTPNFQNDKRKGGVWL